jgi:hypothetical protein
VLLLHLQILLAVVMALVREHSNTCRHNHKDESLLRAACTNFTPAPVAALQHVCAPLLLLMRLALGKGVWLLGSLTDLDKHLVCCIVATISGGLQDEHAVTA